MSEGIDPNQQAFGLLLGLREALDINTSFLVFKCDILSSRNRVLEQYFVLLCWPLIEKISIAPRKVRSPNSFQSIGLDCLLFFCFFSSS